MKQLHSKYLIVCFKCKIQFFWKYISLNVCIQFILNFTILRKYLWTICEIYSRYETIIKPQSCSRSYIFLKSFNTATDESALLAKVVPQRHIWAKIKIQKQINLKKIIQRAHIHIWAKIIIQKRLCIGFCHHHIFIRCSLRMADAKTILRGTLF